MNIFRALRNCRRNCKSISKWPDPLCNGKHCSAYVYVYRDNGGGSVVENEGKRRRNGRPELHSAEQKREGEKTCYQNGPWSNVGRISITLETRDSGLPRILSIHVAPSITHLIERNARNRQLDSVRYIIRPPTSDIDIPGAWVIRAPAKCWAICPVHKRQTT